MAEKTPLINVDIKPLNIRKNIKDFGRKYVKPYVDPYIHVSYHSSTSDTPPPPPPPPPPPTPPPTPPPPPPHYKYDVFLSFRGSDTRTNFTDHLFAALRTKKIHTFRDDEELPRGESISLNISKAIEQSRYAVVVLSQHYADSPWCLNEIEKIIDCSKETGLKVIPVFYDVDPSDVRRQNGNHFKKAFDKHTTNKRYSDAKLKKWKGALFEVGNLSGWELKPDRYESEIIQKVVDKIFLELNEIIHGSNEGLVGMKPRLENMLQSLDVQNNDVKIVGIWGMGGIGKTTLAQVVFEDTKSQFEADCFLENVREVVHKEGVTHLQRKLLTGLLKCDDVKVEYGKSGQDLIRYRLSSKKCLVILDDVDNLGTLKELCNREWYGSGSKIIITSRDEGLLRTFGVDDIQTLEGLDDGDGLKLFKMKAFKESEIEEEFHELAHEFVKYADGLPLAVEVLGSSLRGRNHKFWSETLEKLKKYPDRNITGVLLVSYNGLDETEKRMFLDIACFFKGEKVDRVTRVLQQHSDRDIQTLIEKSLIFIYENKLGMHDMIQAVGWDIIRQQHPEPEKYSRLWRPEEIIRVFDQCKATSEVQSILLQCPTKDNVVHSVGDAFQEMRSLRLLKIWNVKFSGNIDYLSNELQTLEWHECPFDSFPSNFQPDKLVELHMISSCIKNLWMGAKGWRMLRHIDMSASKDLKSTPNFTEVPDLEKLVLQDCTSLVEVHGSLGHLKKLITLNMKNCKSVKIIPPLTGLESLQTLNLALCSKLEKFPEIEGNMQSLRELYLDGTRFEELPPSVESFTGLTTLNLTHCKNLLRVSQANLLLTTLKSLHLTGCSKLNDLPEKLNNVETLEELYIGGTGIRDSSFLVGMKNLKSLSCRGCKGGPRSSLELPTSFSSLTSLRELDLSYCNLKDGAIPDDLFSLITLKVLDLSGNYFARLPESFSTPDSNLETLILRNCRELQSLQLIAKKLPQSLQYVYAQDCTSLKDYPDQIIKVPTSGESGETTINTLINSTALGDSSLGGSLELVLRYKDTEENRADGSQNDDLKQVELLLSLSDPLYRTHAMSEIPEWFSTKSTSNPIWIPTGDQNWKGVAACAVFAVDEGDSTTTADSEISNYLYQITMETDIVSLEPYVINWQEQLRPFRSGSHLLLICYEPRSKFPTWGLNNSNVVRAIFETNNPYMVVQKCGIRLVYEQDAGWYCSKICPDLSLVHLNKGDDDCVVPVVAASGWISQVEDQSWKWDKMIPAPDKEDSNELVLRKKIESLLPRYLQAVRHCCPMYEFQLRWKAMSSWFMWSRVIPDEHGASYIIMKVENLHKEETWMGIAINASVSTAEKAEHIKQNEEEEEEADSYNVHFKFSTKDGECHKLLSRELKHVGSLSSKLNHSVLILYLPRAEIPEALLTETTEIRVSFKFDCPRMTLDSVGNRLVYQEDIEELAETIIQGMQRETSFLNKSFESYNQMVEHDWGELIQKQGEPEEQGLYKTRRKRMCEQFSKDFENRVSPNRDWSTPVPIYCDFMGAEISKWTWFSEDFKESDSAEIQLPPNLFDDDNWLGIAICAVSSFSYRNDKAGYEHNVLSCCLDAHVPSNGVLGLTLHAPLRRWNFAYDMTWFFYIPRYPKSSIKSWRQCKQARVTLSSSIRRMTVKSCALRLIYKKDVECLGKTLTSCLERPTI